MIRIQTNAIRRIALRQLATNSSAEERVDRVSPPHSVSNLRLIKFGKPSNESQIEKQLRLRRIELQEWNQNYWRQNNSDFQKQKSNFIEQELKASKDEEFKSSVSYEELALFYKRFLDANHRKHMNYNL